MSLIDKLKKGAAVGTLAASLALPGCAFQQGREKATLVAIPFFPTYVKHETFKTDSCKEIESAEEIEMSSFFGTAWVKIKKYGENRKYLGMQEVTIKSNWGEYSVSIKSYDAKGKLVKEEDGLSGDLPEGINLNIR